MRAPRLTAAEIAHALGGHRSGSGFVARCPAHDDHSPSLSISDGADAADGKVLVYCHAGCSQDAVIAALQSRGLWPSRELELTRRRVTPARSPNMKVKTRSDRNRDRALMLWDEASPIEGTPAETYLRRRGITLQWPAALRFHERLKHTPTGSHWPAMIALITDSITAEHLGIHRTFLAADGSGKAPVAPQKMMLGPARGGVVRIAETSDAVALGEGIETSLAVQQACQMPIWAALSAGGLKALNLPPGITSVTIFADGDPTGEAAALVAARRLIMPGRTVRIVRAPAGRDFNDLLNDHPIEEK